MTISELGATVCGQVDGRYMCSPMHDLMNASFILLGLAMFIGSVVTYAQLKRSRTGFTLIAFAGIGALFVGIVPMDTVYSLHIVGVDIAFLLGNIALIVFGKTLNLPLWFKRYSVISGTIGLVGFVLFLAHLHLLGLGGTERIVAYPMIVWFIVFGAYRVIDCSELIVKLGKK